jgi:hypothetical protein
MIQQNKTRLAPAATLSQSIKAASFNKDASTIISHGAPTTLGRDQPAQSTLTLLSTPKERERCNVWEVCGTKSESTHSGFLGTTSLGHE